MGQEVVPEYLQGELSRPTVTAIETALHKDPGHPGLAERVRLLQRQHKLLQELGADILHEPVPERLMSILGGAEPAGTRHQALPPPAPPQGGNHRRRGSGTGPAVLILIVGIGIGIGIGIGWTARAAPTSSQTA